MVEKRRFWEKLREKILSLFTGRCTFCGSPTENASCLCEKCRAKLEPVTMSVLGRSYRRACFAYYYTGIGRALLLRYKFSDSWLSCVDPLCEGLIDTYRKHYADEVFDAVVPVPAYETKDTHLIPLVWRLCEAEGLSLCPDYLRKIKKTAHQRDLSAAMRKKNLKNAFRASEDAAGKRILLIDDIFTTGSTVRECSETLLKGGAASVNVLTVFKTKSPE